MGALDDDETFRLFAPLGGEEQVRFLSRMVESVLTQGRAARQHRIASAVFQRCRRTLPR